ncbi:MAG TPA: hypothetical protein VM513_21275 [Kofleriaceae bacterium]|jgi:hypothetical protein|nr:hypothetical protein [Kofleriaceae bacterium]
MKFLTTALVLATPALAMAGGKLLPAKDHSPPLVIDEAGLTMEAVSQSDAGYYLRTRFEMNGLTADSDIIRMDVKSKGKVVATKKCTKSYEDGYSSVECYTNDKAIKATGPIEVDIVYFDDQTEKEYLVRTLKTSAVHMKGQWEVWGIVPDDVLAGGWVYMGHAEANNGTYRKPEFYIWFTNTNSLGNAKLRCTVGGKKIADISVGEQSGSDTEELELDHQPKKGDRLTYHWAKKKLMADIMYGKRDTLKWDMPKTTPPDGVLSDNPGTWECFLRNDGKNIRQITFVVDQDGMIKDDEIQTGKNPIPNVTKNVVFVDVRPTKDAAAFDKRIVPAALKKSLQYGLPWPDHPKVKAIHASFPPKSGMPDPK